MKPHSIPWRRVWLAYIVTSAVLIGADLAYLTWREHSLEPLSVPVDLSRPGSYVFTASGFHSSRYHPEFSLQIPFKTDFMNWFPSQDYRELWVGAPPLVEIEIRDNAGRIVLHDSSTLTRTDGWIVTGTHGVSWIEMYKFAEFDGQMLGSYRVRFNVTRGAARASSYQPVFQIAAIKTYALLGASLAFVALLALVLVAGIVIAVAHLVSRRRQQPNSA